MSNELITSLIHQISGVQTALAHLRNDAVSLGKAGGITQAELIVLTGRLDAVEKDIKQLTDSTNQIADHDSEMTVTAIKEEGTPWVHIVSIVTIVAGLFTALIAIIKDLLPTG